MLRRKSHAGAVGRGSHEFSMPTSTSSSFFPLKSLPRTPPIVEGACARGVVALARAQASSEAHARTRERCPEQQRLKARAPLSLAGVAAGGATPGLGGRHLGDEGAGWAVYMLCRLDGRNDRPCSGARLAEAGSEALGDSSSSLRIAAIMITLLQQQAKSLRCGRSRWRRHSGRCYSALGGGRAGNKTLLITSMLTQQQHRADPANQRTHRPEAAAQMQQRG